MGLANCLIKSGKNLNKEDRQAITEGVDALALEKDISKEAAAKEYIADMVAREIADRQKLSNKIRKAADVPYVAEKPAELVKEELKPAEIKPKEEKPAEVAEKEDKKPKILYSKKQGDYATEALPNFETSNKNELIDKFNELPPTHSEKGDDYAVTPDELQQLLDKAGDGYLYRVTFPEYVDRGKDSPFYEHRYKNGDVKKSISYTSNINDAIAYVLERSEKVDDRPVTDYLIYKIKPSDMKIDGDMRLLIPSDRKDGELVVHSHSFNDVPVSYKNIAMHSDELLNAVNEVKKKNEVREYEITEIETEELASELEALGVEYFQAGSDPEQQERGIEDVSLTSETGEEIGEGLLQSYKPDVKYSKRTDVGAMSVPAAKSLLKKDKQLSGLIDNGKLKVVQSKQDIPRGAEMSSTVQGAYLNDTAYVIAGNNSEENIKNVAWHEVTHAAMDMAGGAEAFLGKAKHAGLMKRLGTIYKMSQKGPMKSNEFYQSSTSIPKDTPTAAQLDELAGYAVENYINEPKSLSASLTKWVKEFISAMKIALFRSTGKLVGKLKPQDLLSISKAYASFEARKAAGERVATGTDVAEPIFLRSIASNLGISLEEAQSQYDDVISKFKDTDEWLKAPNGNNTNLNERQWVQVRTPAFKEWFGDWQNDEKNASKVVDDNGEPMVVYHGTSDDFKKVDLQKGAQGVFWFTTDKGAIERGEVGAAGKGYLVEMFANIRNPANWSQYSDLGFYEYKQNKLDGAMLDEEDGYIGFIFNEASQIKSATINTGQFYEGTDDIRYSEQQQLIEEPEAFAPEETTGQKIARTVQDKMVRFAVVRDWLARNGKELSEKADVWMKEGNMHGKVAARSEDFRELTVKPLIERTQEAGFTMGDISEYLEMKHVPEANERMREIHSDPNATANGIPDDDAAAAIADFESRDNFDEMAEIAADWKAITESTKDILLESGLITKEMADAWSSTYENYVPLKGLDEETQTGTGKGLSVNAKTKRRLGHGKREEAIISNMLRDHERAIMLSEKNVVGVALLNMAVEANNPNLITVNKPVKKQVYKDKALYNVSYEGIDLHSFESEQAANEFIKSDALSSKRNTLAYDVGTSYDPMVSLMASPMLADNEVNVFVDGHAVRTQLNDPLLARAYTNMGVEHLGVILTGARSFNAWLSKAYTGYNPEFAMVNMMRDLFAGTINLSGDYGMVMMGKVYANYPKAFKELLKSFKDPKSSDIVNAYRSDGGNTGASYLPDIERIGADVMDSYNEYAGAIDTYNRVYNESIDQGKSKGYARLKAASKAGIARFKDIPFIGHFLSIMMKVNSVTENALRVATYMTLKENGFSPDKAAQAAKMSTVNFNRKGEIGAQAGALYLFFNPAVQGTERIIKILGSSKHKNQARALTGMMALSAFTIAEIMRAADDDDEWDKIPDYVKDRNIVFSFGKTNFSIPVPYGYGVFHSFGNTMSDVVHGLDGWEAGVRIADSLFGNFMPIGNPIPDGNLKPLQLLPTSIKMAISPEANENNFGRPIQPEMYSSTKPESQNMYRNTKGTIYADAAEALNSITGGNAYMKGGVDVSPETMRFWVTSLTGGAGKFLADSVSLAKITLTGATPELREVPIVRKFVRQQSVSDIRRMFWEAAKESKQAYAEFNAAKAHRDFGTAREIKKGYDDLESLAKSANEYKNLIRAKRDAIDAIRADDNLSLSVKRIKMKEMEMKEIKLYDRFLKIFKIKTDG